MIVERMTITMTSSRPKKNPLVSKPSNGLMIAPAISIAMPVKAARLNPGHCLVAGCDAHQLAVKNSRIPKNPPNPNQKLVLHWAKLAAMSNQTPPIRSANKAIAVEIENCLMRDNIMRSFPHVGN